MNWKNKRVCVTGGASFIGSHLTERLVKEGAKVLVVDNFSTGKRKYLKAVEDDVLIIEGDLRYPKWANYAISGQDYVFHLAAVHGGREFISKYPADCCQSFQINECVFRACLEREVKKVIFTSSVCVYPFELQVDGKTPVKEEDYITNGWYSPDEEYGLAKLTAELSLQAYYKQYGLNSAIARLTTVFGPRENDTHAIIALIKRAMQKKDPYLVWGSGNQGRDWVYVEDVVEGLLLIADKIDDASATNLVGTKMYTIKELVEKIFKKLDWKPKHINFDTTRPEGPKKRLISGEKAKDLGFKPKVGFDKGLERTIKWLKNKKSH